MQQWQLQMLQSLTSSQAGRDAYLKALAGAPGWVVGSESLRDMDKDG